MSGKQILISKDRLKSIIASAIQVLPGDTDPTPYANWALVRINPGTVKNLNETVRRLQVDIDREQEEIDQKYAAGLAASPIAYISRNGPSPYPGAWYKRCAATHEFPLDDGGEPVIEFDGPWLVPFSISGLKLGDLYNLVVIKLSIHGRVFESLCAACEMDFICFTHGRNDEHNASFQCPSLWRSVTPNRRIAANIAKAGKKSPLRIHP